MRGDANNSGLMSRRRRNGQRRNSCVMYARYAREAWDGSAWRPRGRGRRRWPPKQLERVRDGRVRGRAPARAGDVGVARFNFARNRYIATSSEIKTLGLLPTCANGRGRGGRVYE